MPEFLKTVTVYRCARCAREWLPRAARRPVICPRCKSAYWDREPRSKRGGASMLRAEHASE